MAGGSSPHRDRHWKERRCEPGECSLLRPVQGTAPACSGSTLCLLIFAHPTTGRRSTATLSGTLLFVCWSLSARPAHGTCGTTFRVETLTSQGLASSVMGF